METSGKIQIAKHFGLELQMQQLIEEMAELTQAICKHKRKNGKGQSLDASAARHVEENLIEELADVKLVLEQVILLLNAESDVQKVVNQKIERTLERIGNTESEESMTEEERKLMISYLQDMKEEYVEGEGNERYPLPEWYILDKVIKIIEQQPSEDEKIIRIKKGTLKARTGRYVIYDVEWLKTHFNTTESKIYGQPSERTEERTETHACDCISRAEAIKALEYEISIEADGGLDKYRTVIKGLVNAIYNTQKKAIEDLPSIQPQPKTGHWEWVQYDSKPNFGNWHCSECRYILCGAINGNLVRLPKYCPECGSYNGGKK